MARIKRAIFVLCRGVAPHSQVIGLVLAEVFLLKSCHR
jgi:hypothetical protein